MTVDFRSRTFLIEHIRHTMAFYNPRVVDPAGGFFQLFKNDGTVYDPSTRMLVASCRHVFNYAMAYRRFGNPEYLARVRHGIAYLREVHRNPETGGYAWRIVDRKPADTTNHCYGLAFALLAYDHAFRVGMTEARGWIDETFEVLEKHFWSEKDGLYANEADAAWHVRPYRGQNDNMHCCEALITAFEVTGEKHFLDRAALIATNITRRQAALTDGHVWEHFHEDWSPDLDYARGDNSNNIRPWGVQTGHQTEWAKLLLILERHCPEPWRLPRARALFDRAIALGWEQAHGGLVNNYGLDGVQSDKDKYFWVQAESIAAAALLADATGEESYWQTYDRIWDFAWTHMVDHKYGAWFRILNAENKQYDDRKSYNNKADYHTMGACYEVLNVV